MKTYEDLEDSIDLFLTRKKQYENEKKKLSELCFGARGLKSTSFDITGIKNSQSFISLEDYICRIQKIDENLIKCKEMLDLLFSQRYEINDKLSKLTGRKYEIFYLYRVKNIKFEGIAEKLDLSERQVRRIYQDVIK